MFGKAKKTRFHSKSKGKNPKVTLKFKKVRIQIKKLLILVTYIFFCRTVRVVVYPKANIVLRVSTTNLKKLRLVLVERNPRCVSRTRT